MRSLPIVLGVLAVATSVPAWFTFSSSKAAEAVITEDPSAVLGKAGADPLRVTKLRIVDWDASTATAKPFEVKRDNGQWVITSRYNYPAEKNRVGEVAGGMLGGKRGALVLSDSRRLAEFKLLDPTGKDTTAKEGYGRLVQLEDDTGSSVLRLIIGDASPLGQGRYYVREQDSNDVYSAKIPNPNTISTRFTDYVETDPLKVQRDAIREVTILDYSVKSKISPEGRLSLDEIQERARTLIAKPTGSDKWASAQVPAKKQVAQAKIDSLLSTLTSITLTGVQPFDGNRLPLCGIFFTGDPTWMARPDALVFNIQGQKAAMISNEGRLDFATKDGLRYSLVFGGVAPTEDGDDAKKDEKKDDKKAEKKDAEKKDDKPTGNNRYVSVFVNYIEALDEDAKAAAEAAKKDEKAPKPDPKRSGKERAAKAAKRFQAFFYVISDSTFKSLRPALDTLFEDLPPEPMAGKTGKTNKQWLDDNAKKDGWKTTPSGLQYKVLAAGPEGGRKPASTDEVKVAYKGTLVEGEIFDENADMSFFLNGVIKGWTEGLQLMKEGDKFQFAIPPEIAYGSDAKNPKIPANSILIFDVTLKSILTPPPAPPAPPAAPVPAAPPTAVMPPSPPPAAQPAAPVPTAPATPTPAKP